MNEVTGERLRFAKWLLCSGGEDGTHVRAVRRLAGWLPALLFVAVSWWFVWSRAWEQLGLRRHPVAIALTGSAVLAFVLRETCMDYIIYSIFHAKRIVCRRGLFARNTPTILADYKRLYGSDWSHRSYFGLGAYALAAWMVAAVILIFL